MSDILEIYTEDTEFEALIRSGLNSSFDAENISVSESLIAKTLAAVEKVSDPSAYEMTDEELIGTAIAEASATEKATAKSMAADNETSEHSETSGQKTAEPVNAGRKSRAQIIRIVGGIAAAAIIGVVGISFLKNGVMSSKGNATAMDSTMAFSTSNSTSNTIAPESIMDDSALCTEETDDRGYADTDGATNSKADIALSSDGYSFSESMTEEVTESSAIDFVFTDNATEDSSDNYILAPGITYYANEDYSEYYMTEKAELMQKLYDCAEAYKGAIIYQGSSFNTSDVIGDNQNCYLAIYDYVSLNSESILVYDDYIAIETAILYSSNNNDYQTVICAVDNTSELITKLMALINEEVE